MQNAFWDKFCSTYGLANMVFTAPEANYISKNKAAHDLKRQSALIERMKSVMDVCKKPILHM